MWAIRLTQALSICMECRLELAPSMEKLQDKVGGRLKGGDVGIRLFDDCQKLRRYLTKPSLTA
ncbi:hypothetical protein [Moraxella ovis]|uniref:hypothetical protein n=1 Tax=Moraxella ovis TaxID=29433 RepID=UPI0021ABC93C|nr:hypothetical protein [Moraxella ovis]